jgi:site-specific DNA recombinase
MKQAAIYARVSSDKQEERRTIESQVAELRKACRAAGVIIVKEYTDGGFSGSILARPGLDQLRKDASLGLFQTAYILSPDRLARKYVHQALVLEELGKLGIQVFFTDKELTDSPEDQLLLGFQGLIAEYERALVMERTRRGRLHCLRKGELMGGIVPYGYRYVPKSKNRGAHLEVHPQEARVVRLIFSLYAKQQLSTVAVARQLMDKGIKTKTSRTHWRPAQVRRILQNECYVGRSYYNKFQGSGRSRARDRSEWILVKTPLIVDSETFRLAQRLLRARRRTPRASTRVYLLSGLLRCRSCGSGYSGFRNSTASPSYYYRCTSRSRRSPLPGTCRAGAVKAERVEAAVVKTIGSAVLDPEVLKARLLEAGGDIQKLALDWERKLVRLQRQQNLLTHKRVQLLDGYLEGRMSKVEYLARRAAAEEKLKRLAEQILEAKKIIPALDEETLTRSARWFSNMAKASLKDTDPESLWRFLHLLCDEILYDWQSRAVTVRGNVPVVPRKGKNPTIDGADHKPRASASGLLRLVLKARV